MATDPVCGMTVEPAKAAGSAEHGGSRYYFCSKHCLARFNADPGKYAATPKPAAAPSAAKAGAVYTCPMHPQIVRDAPDDCPLCGMALVPVGGAPAGDDSELRDLTRRLWAGIAL